jgi:hypothetical protein
MSSGYYQNTSEMNHNDPINYEEPSGGLNLVDNDIEHQTNITLASISNEEILKLLNCLKDEIEEGKKQTASVLEST